MTTLRRWALFVAVGALCGGPLAGCVQQDGGGDDEPDMRAIDGEVAAACEDGRDNDGDGRIDLDDRGCDSPADNDESGEPALACGNGRDDDGDGRVDLDDRGCSDTEDDDESDDPPTQCDNGIDDDGDGAIDLEDRGCANARDDDESGEPPLPACQNGIDDDDDGFIDFPGDPGCGSTFDDDERDGGGGPLLPQCSNGIDDDNDGDVDLADSGCSSVADPREALAPDAPAPLCKNGIDDDLDGIVDFPRDPGCSAAGDEDEADPAVPPACGNGVDDDGDGATDYPNDPGCQGVGDRDEADPAVTPACADGVDNDGDGSADYPDDRGCESAADASEGGACGRTYEAVEVRPGRVLRGDSRGGAFESEGSCGGRGAPEIVFVHRVERRIEALVIRTDLPENQLESAIYVRRGCLDGNSEIACSREELRDGIAANELVVPEPSPGEYYIFLDGATGRGGEFAMIIEEVPLAACLNGEDDDGDGRVDYPNDPGCRVPDDRDETDPEVLPACFDNRDNDGDGEVDFPLDFGCQSAADEDEVDVCGQGLRIFQYPVDAPFVLGDTSDGSTVFQGSCQSGGPEKVFVYENTVNAALTFTVDFPETTIRTSLYVRRECTVGGTELGCGTDGENELEPRGSVALDRAPPGTYFVFVDTQFGLGGPFKLAVQSRRLPPGCSDGVDNDEDGFIDADDVGCSGLEDEDERDPVGEQPACFDRADNDGDGAIDYPFDPGCFGKGDDDEADPDEQPECNNGVDDDMDGLVDFPLDPGCAARGDDTEQGDRRNPQCTNRIDDDMDGFTDYPLDPGCAAPGDLSEADDREPPPCFDDIDNDRDGLIDFPFDPGCLAAGHVTEVDPEVPFACSNGQDDDGDGIIDFPFDPGCQSAGEDDEADTAFPPACANRIDDDGDGRVDWPDDRGCRFQGDTSEVDPFDPPSRCENSVDDDGDGAIDLRDPGCTNRDDDDELDPVDPPECGNGIDDDRDGLIDWPDDYGCQARGDSPESQACREGVEVIDIAPGEVAVGRTEAGGADNYRGRCGGREAPDHVYRYVLEAPGDLRISADNPGTDFPVVLNISRDCEEPRAAVACAGDFQRPEPTVVLRDAEPGEYFITVDGGGPERWVSDGGGIAMPVDPNGFVASNNDIGVNGWSDGGRDAFDGYGSTRLTVGGVAQQVDVSLGVRQFNVGGMAVRLTSEFVSNVWRLRYEPVIANDETPVDFSITGNMGSDGGIRAQQPRVEFAGRQLTYLFTTDAGPNDPPVVHLFVPSDPEQIGAVTYANAGDNVTITVRQITLPATFYVALSYAAGLANPGVVANALVDDLEIQAGGGGAEAPRFGNYELTVDEQ